MERPFENKPEGLRWADENDIYATIVEQCCDKCRYFSTISLACLGGWCAKYPSEKVNCSIGEVCDLFESRG